MGWPLPTSGSRMLDWFKFNKPDISLVNGTGHLEKLTTGWRRSGESGKDPMSHKRVNFPERTKQ